MESANKIKASFTAFLAVLISWIGILAVPVIILVAFNIIDYITGLAASIYRKEPICSYKSFRGIAKKICQWLLVVVAVLIDWLMVFSLEYIGIKIPFAFLVGCAAAIWLNFNEVISIIENMKDIGVKIPPFLKPLAKYIKRKVEEKATIGEDTDGS